MPNTIFFSWQLDTPSKNNKSFVWAALNQACEELKTNQPEESPRPIEGAAGVPGAPNIVDSIFKRISECSVFVADLTFVAESTGGRKIPNPNVLIELGYAARCIGWERTILVMNSAFGSANNLPFDILQHRWPIEFKVTDKTQTRDERQERLSGTLSQAIRDCETYLLERAVEMASQLDGSCLCFIAANYEKDQVEMPAGPGGAVVKEMNAAIRLLLRIGALHVADGPNVPAFGWTYAGKRMIEHLISRRAEFFAKLQSMTKTSDS